MCGICGVVGGDREREEGRVAAMSRALAHRGPDGHGLWADDGAVLGHRRLAVIDPSPAGRQPMGSADGRFWITYNGEVYNYRELRRELETLGASFRTGTDTEVVLELFRREGAACLPRLNGMFAFAVWDRVSRRLFAARDPFGQKPFYYAVRGRRFLFASEVKGLLAHPEVPAEPDLEAVDDFLSLRFIAAPATMVRGVRKLPAGHWLAWGEAGLRTGRHFELSFPEAGDAADGDAEAELRDRLEEAVAAHMTSDVPVGAFLSGGLDSSVVVAAMARRSPEPVDTFCVGSGVPGFDERPHARLLATRYGTRHRESCVSPGLLSRIPELVAGLDEPCDPIAACFDEAARLAARHRKVVLGGDGGDEIFGGFDRYAAFGWAERYAALPRWVRGGVLGPLIRSLRESFGYKSLSQRARWLDSVGRDRGGRLYARMTAHFRFGPEDKAWLYGPALQGLVASRDALAAVADPFERAPSDVPLNRMLYADLLTRFPEHTLALSDRLGMAHGLEVRAPFLDRELVRFGLSVPAGLRVRGRTTKAQLRSAVRPWLPEPLVERPKQGFMFPVAYWLDAQALARVRTDLSAGSLVREGWIDGAAVERLVGEHARGRTDHHVRLWMLLSLEAWHRLYVEGRGAETSVSEPLPRAGGLP